VSTTVDVHTLYNEHPINYGEILAKAEAAGANIEQLQAEDLWAFDQDHYGGLLAVDALAQALALDSKTQLLDLCSGMGGPARYIAIQYGCRIQGVDLNQSRVDGATELSRLTGLSEQLAFAQGDCCELPLADASFDRAMSQEAFLHIENRERLLSECRRVLIDSGKLGFTDWIGSDSLTTAHREKFASAFAAPRICSVDEYRSLLDEAGFEVEHVNNLSDEWQDILRKRLEMFQSLEQETVARFGQQRHDTYIENYVFFVDRIEGGDLGGARFIARAI